MSLKWLSTREMIELSAPWVDRGDEGGPRRMLLDLPELAALLPRMEQAHQALLHTQIAPTDPRLAGAAAEAIAVDARHDDVVHGIHAVLGGWAALSTERAEASRLLALRDRMLPDGVGAAQRSYREEASHANAVAASLDDDMRRTLAAVPGPEGSLLRAVEEWIELGGRLERLEDERVAHEHAARAGSEGEEGVARNRWARVVAALISNLELCGAPGETTEAVIGPLRLAVRRAERGSGRHLAVPAADAADAAWVPTGEG